MNTAIGGHASQEENESAFLANIEALADAAEDAGVDVALEIHGDIMASGARRCRCSSASATRASRSPTTRATASSTATSRPSTTSPRSLPYLANVHLKDKRGGKGVWDFPEPGDGTIDFGGVLGILEAGGYSGPLSVEIEFQGEPWPPLAEVDAVDDAGLRAPERTRPGMIDVAILGGGFMGQTHAGAWAALARARAGRRRLVAHAGARRRASPRCAGRRRRDDLYAPLERDDVDVVDICLPTPLHREAAERAFAAGKHVLLEKPIALTLEDAEAIVAAARARRQAARGRPRAALLARVRRSCAGSSTAGELGPAARRERAAALAAAGLERLDDRPGALRRRLRRPDGARLRHAARRCSARRGASSRVRCAAGRTARAQHCHAIVEHEGGEAIVEGGLMQPDSYPFSSNLRVLCERGVVEYPFSAAPAADGGNIGGVDQAANRLRVHPADGPMRLVDVASADPWAGQAAAVARLAGARRGADRGDRRAGHAGPARLARGQPLARERRRRRRLTLTLARTSALVAASSASAAATASRVPQALMPSPSTGRTCVNPRRASSDAPSGERVPVWHTTAVGRSGSSAERSASASSR